MAKDERVNGAAIAAEILNKMPSAHRERIVGRIKIAAPELADRISSNMLSFDDIAELTPQSVQRLISEVPHQDLVVSFKTASQVVQTVFLSNMTERKRSSLLGDLSLLPKMRLEEVQAAQDRILRKLDELRTIGAARSVGSCV